ncbi:hypothetical protein JOM56_015264 [Amanita muscaria]
MPPKRKLSKAAVDSQTGPGEDVTQSHAPAQQALPDCAKPSPCSQCRTRKIKCEWNGNACYACIKSGKQELCSTAALAVTRTTARGRSLPPTTSVASSAPATRKRRYESEIKDSDEPSSQPSTTARRTRYNGPGNLDQVVSLGSTSSSFTITTATSSLMGTSIAECDEDEDLKDLDDGMMLDGSHPDAPNHASIVSALRIAAEHDDGHDDGNDVMEIESDNDSDDVASIPAVGTRQRPVYAMPTVKRRTTGKSLAAQGRKHSVSASRVADDIESVASDEASDPETCVFKISAAVKKPDGSNIPFIIKSSISYEDLRNTVAEKLRRHPNVVQLRYKLDDKPKTSTTSIQSPDELEIFEQTMRLLLVPQRLANGKISSRKPKIVTVFFEDGADDTRTIAPEGSASGGKKKASPILLCYVFFHNKPNSSSSSTAVTEISRDNRANVEAIKDLQEKWHCPTHSKGEFSAVYCYKEPPNQVCYGLSFSDLGMWASEIARGLTIAEMKPKNLVLKARDPGLQHQSQMKMKDLDKRLVTAPAPQPNYQFIIPPWTYHPPTQGMPSFQPNSNFSVPGMSGVPMATMPPVSPPQSALNPELLGIIKWFQALDADEKCRVDNVCFSDLGHLLSDRGFFKITQLSPKIIKLKQLVQWLGIKEGIAVLIFQYAEEDIEMFRAGGVI